MAASMRSTWCRKLLTLTRFGSQKRHIHKSMRCHQTDAKNLAEASAEELFLNENVQKLLRRLTGFNINKIFRDRPMKDLKPPNYELMTDEQLKQAQVKAISAAQEFLKMPPIMDARDNEAYEIISDDPEIAGFDDSNLVFTDITYGLPNWKRTITVREPSGLLRTANPVERDRMLQVYYPIEGRTYKTPEMFQPEMLQRVLNEHRYEYVLDRACVQFEPDDPLYIRTLESVYKHIIDNNHYEDLYSTRHYGGLVLYLVRHHYLDGLLLHLLQTEQIDEGQHLVSLFNLIHPNSKTAEETTRNKYTEADDIIKAYIENDSKQKGRLSLAYQAIVEGQHEATS